MIEPSLIIPILGDSNAGSGESWTSSDDVTHSQVLMLDRNSLNTTPATMLATETLLQNGSHGNAGMSSSVVGDSVALAKLLAQRGNIPQGFANIILVGAAWAGTAFPGQWAITGARAALDGSNGFYSMVEAALGLNSGNRIWFFDWVFGANCFGDGSFESESQALFTEIRSSAKGLAGAAAAPILVTGIPPDRVTINGSTGSGSVTGPQQTCSSWLPNSYYVDPSGLHSYMDNGFVHFNAASHRGGTDNSKTTTASYTSGTWYWDNTVTYASGNFVLGSDNWCYKSLINSNLGNDPTTDNGTHWQIGGGSKTVGYQWGQTVTNPLSERKYSIIVNNPAFYQFTGTW